jgi:hypothetical protein
MTIVAAVKNDNRHAALVAFRPASRMDARMRRSPLAPAGCRPGCAATCWHFGTTARRKLSSTGPRRLLSRRPVRPQPRRFFALRARCSRTRGTSFWEMGASLTWISPSLMLNRLVANGDPVPAQLSA